MNLYNKKILSTKITILFVITIALSSYFFTHRFPSEVKCIEKYVSGINKASVKDILLVLKIMLITFIQRL